MKKRFLFGAIVLCAVTGFNQTLLAGPPPPPPHHCHGGDDGRGVRLATDIVNLVGATIRMTAPCTTTVATTPVVVPQTVVTQPAVVTQPVVMQPAAVVQPVVAATTQPVLVTYPYVYQPCPRPCQVRPCPPPPPRPRPCPPCHGGRR